MRTAALPCYTAVVWTAIGAVPQKDVYYEEAARKVA